MVEESVRALKPRVTMVRFCGVLTLFLSKKSGTTKVDLHNSYLIDFFSYCVFGKRNLLQ